MKGAKTILSRSLACLALGLRCSAADLPPESGASRASGANEVRLITLDPGHFHASLLHKEMWTGVSETVHVYAPLGSDLLEHLERLRQFNSRLANPTRWQVEIHAGPHSLERLLVERPGNVVVLSGRNQGKIERISRLVSSGMHVLADKPWILESSDLPELKATLEEAEARGVAAYDAMTQRFEITCLIQRELVNDPSIFGEPEKGSRSDPAVRMESVHYLLKEVAGVVNRRPAWYFDIHQQGEGLTDVGTHLVDLVPWILFPEQAIDCDRDVRVLEGCRWPTLLTRAQLEKVTGDPGLALATDNSTFAYDANNSVLYTVRGVHVAIRLTWDFEPKPGQKDAETAVFKGTRSSVEVRQGPDENFRPEVYLRPHSVAEAAGVGQALRQRIALMGKRFPGLGLEELEGIFRVTIPEELRAGHEAHFGMLTRQFLEFVRSPESIPHWERPNMIAKYHVTTKGVELARRTRATATSAAKGK